MTDCIHGLELAMCDVCTPRPLPEGAVPPPTRRSRAASRNARRSEPTRPGAAVALQGAIQRRFLVVAVEGLGEEYGAADESDWSGLVPAGLTKDRVVIVGTSETLEVQFVAVANEPARRIVRDSLAAVGVDARVMVQPDWFS